MNAPFLASVLSLGQAAGLAGTVVGPLDVGSASGEPGEVVDLPVHFSSPHTLCAFSVLIRYERGVLEFLGYGEVRKNVHAVQFRFNLAGHHTGAVLLSDIALVKKG